MLVIAGILEAFLSPTSESVLLKFTIAAALFLLLILYLSSARLTVEKQRLSS